jgi:hypothetical protein
VYYNALMKYNSRNGFDWLRNLHTMDMVEEDSDVSKQCSKMLEYKEDRVASDGHQHNSLVERKNINNTQSWANFFALSLSNPTRIIEFVRPNNVLHKFPFHHLAQYCTGKKEIEIS